MKFVKVDKPTPDRNRKFYRFHEVHWAGAYNELEDDYGPGHSTVEEYVFYLIKETPQGYWITDEWQINKKWVSKTAKKRYAYPDREQALDSYIKRKENQIRILAARLSRSQELLYKAKSLKEKLTQKTP